MLRQCYQLVGKTLKKIYADYPNCIRKDYPSTSLAETIVQSIIQIIKDEDFSHLAKNSPALVDCNWPMYLTCSIIRMVKVLAATQKILTQQNVRVLDFGSYFGNFSLMFAKSGYSVDAIDSYRHYEGAFSKITNLLKENNVTIHDFSEIGYDLGGFAPDHFDVVICLGVIEHIPHTPRLLLESINRVLKPGGFLILDTPNLAYIYNHNKLKKGLSIFPPIEQQYFTEIPFVGHHREYTISEIKWLINNLGHRQIILETFFYSIYGLSSLIGKDLINYFKMKKNHHHREIILSVSQKPGVRPD